MSTSTIRDRWINVSACHVRLSRALYIVYFNINPAPLDDNDEDKILSVKLDESRMVNFNKGSVYLSLEIHPIGFTIAGRVARTEPRLYTPGSSAQTKLGLVSITPHIFPVPTASTLSCRLFQEDRLIQTFETPWSLVEKTIGKVGTTVTLPGMANDKAGSYGGRSPNLPAKVSTGYRYTLSQKDLVAAPLPMLGADWSEQSVSSPPPYHIPVAQPPVTPQEKTRHVTVNLSPVPVEPQPVSFNRPYNLTFNVADILSPQMWAVALTPSGFTAEDKSEVTFRILLETKDFKVRDPVQDLIVGPTGPGVLAAIFEIEPLHLGGSKIRAILYRGARWLQRILIDINVDQNTATITHLSTNFLLPTTTTPGPPPAMSINVYRAEGADDSFRCIISERRQMKPFRLALTSGEMSHIVDKSRTALLDIVQYADEKGELVFQKDVLIPKKDSDLALAALATAGLRMFSKVFKANSNDREADTRAEEMRQSLTRGKTYVVQIVSGDAPLPWGLLYLGTDLDNPRWDLFLGMRHIVELGLEEAPIPPTNTIARTEKLKVSLNFNPQLDISLRIDPDHECSVTRQKEWWSTARLGEFIEYRLNETVSDVVASLKRRDDHLIFFYCHGHSGDGDPWLSLTGMEQDRIFLDDLIPQAPTTQTFMTPPLIIINACESAGRTTHFFDGFVPYFLKKGALGLIGTECNIPAVFAVHFVQELFEEIFHGEMVGPTMLKLRKRYLETQNNPLGLLYASFCEAETRIDPSFFPSDSDSTLETAQ